MVIIICNHRHHATVCFFPLRYSTTGDLLLCWFSSTLFISGRLTIVLEDDSGYEKLLVLASIMLIFLSRRRTDNTVVLAKWPAQFYFKEVMRSTTFEILVLFGNLSSMEIPSIDFSIPFANMDFVPTWALVFWLLPVFTWFFPKDRELGLTASS